MDYIKKILDAGFIFFDDISKVTSMEKHNVVCPNGHKIFTRINNLAHRLDKRSSKGCIHCRQEELDKLSLENAQKHLPEGFKLLGSYRKEVDRKEARTIKIYKIECSEGHNIECESGHMKNLSCAKCSEQIYVGQERTRKIFEEVFGVSFKSIRPDWLKNPKTGRNLELDGYNEDLNIAFEYQGNQHFHANTQFQDEHYAQAERDGVKKEICNHLGINLVEIKQPTSYNQEKFINQILEQMKKQINFKNYSKYNFNFNQKKFHFKDLTFNGVQPNVIAFIDFCLNDAPIKGYTCITTDFHTYEDPIEMCCPKGHIFDTTAAEFKRNVLGVKGRSIPCKVCYSKENVVPTAIDLNYCIEEGAKYGLTLLSSEYKNVNEKMNWIKESGEVIELSFRQIQRSKTKKF